ncbi:endonuclease/exonuclease/phosphatase family protein [Thalassoglobus sp.]|uniref:endonuclease/exonuclease/phosphatase family protein n=1 Tax=Thalassoglobus sp. TaxID=2795869 RepID=UPI003AA813F2
MIQMFTRYQCLALLILLTFTGSSVADEPQTLRVMTFNLWVGGEAGGQPLSKSAEVIQKAGADVVGLQETAGRARAGTRLDRAEELAEILGWNYLNQNGRTAIISRFPILRSTPNKWGAEIQLPSKQTIFMFNAHLAHAPYQPYQLLNIPYHNGAFLKTEQEAIAAAKSARGEQVQQLLSEINAFQKLNLPMFVTGDFNEPSHLDWTAEAVEAEQSPISVRWPSTDAVLAAGFVDGYRVAHPDPVKKRGLTWTPLTKETDPKDRHDRIDFVMCSTKRTRVTEAKVIGESKQYADIIVENYPSDHRAVVVEVKLIDEPK